MKNINDFFEKDFEDAKVWHQNIKDEIEIPLTAYMFMGAWYHKCISQKDAWLGIEAIVTLPEFFPDPNRMEFIEPKTPTQKLFYRSMDSPSIYLGGNAGFETDIGLAYQQGYLERGANALSPVKNCYRPFWRYIVEEDGKTKNYYNGTSINDFKTYFFPGDKIKMRVNCVKEDHLRLSIELIEPTNILKYRKLRKNLDIDENDKIEFVSPLIISKGQGTQKAEFKRVNAIDQFYNEGKRNLNTDCYTTKTIWHEVYLFRIIDDKIYRVPFLKKRYSEINCPVEGSVIKSNEITDKNLGGEEVAIDPRNVLY